MGALEQKLERMKEMEDQLQRLRKVEEEVEDLRSAEKDNRALRESNEQLRLDLDKRDQAVNEAVQLICQLEAKIDQLEAGARTSHLSMSRLVLDGPEANTPKVQAAVEIPERASSRLKTSSSHPNQQTSADLRQLSKAPSFLRADNQSTATLRSLYAPENNKSHTACSELTKSESFNTMNDVSELGSPRLSVLSEASELNPFDTPSKWQDDKLKIPVRKAPSADSLDSYVPPTERNRSNPEQINQWLQSRPDSSDTIIQRRQNRPLSDASKSVVPAFHGDLSSNASRARLRLDTSIFGGVRLPPTPDTMSTAYAAVNNGSNGSIVPQKSPKHGGHQWFAGRQLDRHRSADELTTRRSFNGSDITDSMQTNCSDTPRANEEAPTIFPFNTVAPKASELLGPGSPNNPAINSFNDRLRQNSKDEATPPTVKRDGASTKTTALESRSNGRNPSPSLSPQDWLAAATRSPQSGKETTSGVQSGQQETQPNHNALRQTISHDTQSIDSHTSEPDAPGIPTLDMNALDILEQPAPSTLAAIPEPQHYDPESEEPRPRFSLQPSFPNKTNSPRRLQSSPMAPDYTDDEDDGAPSPNIPKHRNTPNTHRRPMSQIITDSADLYQPSIPAHGNNTQRPSPHEAVHQSFLEARQASLPPHPGSATISSRPSTSHSADHRPDHKRRSSLGIFGWMKNVGGKRSENTHSFVAESFTGSVPVQQKEHRARLVKEAPCAGAGARRDVPRASSPELMKASRSEMSMSMLADDTARRPRYMGRRARRG